MEAGQSLGVTVSLQTDGTLDLFFQQLQGLCESPGGEKDHTRQTDNRSKPNILSTQEVGVAQTYFFGVGASAIVEYSVESLDGCW